MIPKRAIELSIEEGWTPFYKFTYNEIIDPENWRIAALDPTFWQALGKVLDWKGSHMDALGRDQWLIAAQRFNYLILTGGDTEKFWRELLQGKKGI